MENETNPTLSWIEAIHVRLCMIFYVTLVCYLYLLKSVARRIILSPLRRAENDIFASETGAINKAETSKQISSDEHIHQNSPDHSQFADHSGLI